MEVCVEAARAIERYFRYSGDSSSGILAEVALSIFAAVIGDWYSMEEAQVCLELLGPGWGLTQADAMGGWELRGLLRRVMFKAESLICGKGEKEEEEMLRKSLSRKKNAKSPRRPSLNEGDAMMYVVSLFLFTPRGLAHCLTRASRSNTGTIVWIEETNYGNISSYCVKYVPMSCCWVCFNTKMIHPPKVDT